MRRYVIRRVLALVPVLFLVTLVSFFMIYLSPGDPVDAKLTQNGGIIDMAAYQALRAQLGLDRPIPVQYLSWLAGVLHGDLGTSVTTGIPVAVEIGRRLPATVLLAVASMAVTLAISVPLGVLCAVRRNRATDLVVRVASFFGASMPGFLMALILVYVFAIGLKVLPSLGSPSGVGWVLPVATLALCESASFIRQIRTLTITELDQDYVVAMRLRGISEGQILRKSVLKAIMPTILLLAGISLGQLLGGTAIVETIFAWPGLGSYAVQMIGVRDYPVIQGYILLLASAFVVVNLVVDLCHARLDPRVRAQLARGEGGAR